MKVLVKVTQEIIDADITSTRLFPCPVDKALRAAGFDGAEAGGQCWYQKGWPHTYHKLPIEAQRFIRQRDGMGSKRTNDLKPFEFEVEVPEETLENAASR